jgi:uncharacterized protein
MSLQQSTYRLPPQFARILAFVQTFFFSVWGLIAAILAAIALIDPGNFAGIATDASRSFAGTLPYIIFAVTMIAWLTAAGAESIIAKAFEGREIRMILLAALIGGLAPFCSCEVVPFIAGLLAVGAPLSAVMAFWLASPLIDPPALLITASALGWEFAIAKAIGAVLLGATGGFAMLAMMRAGAFANPLRNDSPVKQRGCGCGCGPADISGKPVWKFWAEDARRAAFGQQWSANMIFLGKWLIFAYLLQALLVEYVPSGWIGSVVGGSGLLSITTGALVGAPAYLNSYVAPPLVAGLMEQGMSSGAAMAFMIAGAVSCIPAMAAIWALVRRTIFFAYLGLGIGGAILLGVLFQIVA